MGLIVLSLILSIILGCCAWLVLGETFPLTNEQKWPVVTYIICYALLVLIPVYLVIFFIY